MCPGQHAPATLAGAWTSRPENGGNGAAMADDGKTLFVGKGEKAQALTLAFGNRPRPDHRRDRHRQDRHLAGAGQRLLARGHVPAREKPSAGACKVTVLPVPVAPVIRPWTVRRRTSRLRLLALAANNVLPSSAMAAPFNFPVCLSMRPPTWRARVSRGTSAPCK